MPKEANEQLATKILGLFSHADLDKHMLDGVAFWVKYLASVTVMAKIVYFCERVLNED